ncbi:hypothetical protein BGW39_001976 [Mortierella sp. 14UC]|nr:hypothetical protein BGW39_001976 [Mortierella sp. 14UC]
MGDLVDRSGDSEPEIMRALVTHLKPATLASFYFYGPTGDCDLVSSTVKRHFQSLHKFEFESGEISSEDIRLILTQCSLLEEFKVKGSVITLQDAVESTWASNRIRRLELVIAVGERPDEDEPYYERPPPLLLTPKEEARFTLLRKLYEQIGSLVEMEELILKAIHDEEPYSDEYEDYKSRAFPAMLSLGTSGRPGISTCLQD